MLNQQIRPSQFITTYGPGSILETRDGPVIIPSVDRIFLHRNLAIERYTIDDARLTRHPHIKGARIVRLPSNAEEGLPDSIFMYPTEAFPYWGQCTHHKYIYKMRTGCPNCAGRSFSSGRGREAIRFVQACPNGHLDDVDWSALVHNGQPCGRDRDHFIYDGGGGGLNSMTITCVGCTASRNFGQAYSSDFYCRGRFPETNSKPTGCTERAKIIHRGASNLRVAVTINALRIPELSSRLHVILMKPAFITAVKTLQRYNNFTQENFFKEAAESIEPPLKQDDLAYLLSRNWEQIQRAVSQILEKTTQNELNPKEEEFASLEQAAKHGDSQASQNIDSPPYYFELRHSDVNIVNGPANLPLRVAAVRRLTVIMVQTAYQRFVHPDLDKIQEVPTLFSYGGTDYFPGVELFGEGIYIDCDELSTKLTGRRAADWLALYRRHSLAELHPIHVWWHTLAHRLIRSLSVDSGYSSSSIRERVYFRIGADGSARGGILLYACQPGADGTLGGLQALAANFKNVLATANIDLESCSNDPICEDAAPHKSNGAACYACLLLSETSCDHRNMQLDRMLLLETK